MSGAALLPATRAAIEDAAVCAAGSAGVEQLEITRPRRGGVGRIGAGESLAAATVRSGGDGGNYEITASVTGPTGYVEEVRRSRVSTWRWSRTGT